MIGKRHTSKVAVGLMALAVILCLAVLSCPEQIVAVSGGTGVTMEYEIGLFDREEILNIDIRIEEEAWEALLLNASEEEYVSCDVVVNGECFYSVAIRPKGNTSLSAIASDPTTDRYSFKLEFDRYMEGQSLYGLDKLILNNQYADASNMKEAVVYDMYAYLDADASLYNYAKVSVNGEYWGLYLALEAVEESFMLRCYGTQNGRLYKPEMEMGGGRPFGNGNAQEGGMQAGGGSGNAGADLNYTDDALESYSAIWDGEITDGSRRDHERVVEALRQIHTGTEPEQYLDVDNVLKYMAVHAFCVNMDSLSGNMAHNYYLYEYGGRLNILPWDYNLAFGGMPAGADSAAEMINDAVDTPFSGTGFFDFLLENEEYLEQYHEYLRMLAQEYVLDGHFAQVYEKIRAQIDELVKTDPTAFYSYEEYEAGAKMLYQTILLRAESVCGQIDGQIPSTDEGQRENREALLDASEIDVSVMGEFQMGGGRMHGGNLPDGEISGNEEISVDGERADNEKVSGNGGMTGGAEKGDMPEGFVMPWDGEGMESEEGAVKGDVPEGFEMPPDGERMEFREEGGRGDLSAEFGTPPGRIGEMGENMTQDAAAFAMGREIFDRQGVKQDNPVSQNLILYAVCLCIILFALAVAKNYRRRGRRKNKTSKR